MAFPTNWNTTISLCHLNKSQWLTLRIIVMINIYFRNFAISSDISIELSKTFPNQIWCCTILYISLIKFVYGLPETNCLNMRTRWPQPKIMRPKCPTQTFPLATVVCSQRQINYKRGLSVGVLIHYEHLLLNHLNNK